MNRVFQSIVIFLVAAIICGVGVFMPAYWKVVVPEVLPLAGSGSETVTKRIEFFLQSEKPGVVALMESTPGLVLTNREFLGQSIQDLLARRPLFRLSGGAEPYFERIFQNTFSPDQFETLLAESVNSHGIVTNTASLMLNQSLRLKVFELLNDSHHGVIRDILELRQLPHFGKLRPVHEPSGAALDVAVLTTALLIQSDYLDHNVVQTLHLWAQSASQGPNRETEKLENFLLDILNCASRLGYLSLCELMRLCSSVEFIHQVSELSQDGSGNLPVFATAAVMTRDLGSVARYWMDSPDPRLAAETLTSALNAGVGAVEFILNSHPMYLTRKAPFLSFAIPANPPTIPFSGLTQWAVSNPATAFGVRLLSFALAGLLLVFALQRFPWPQAESASLQPRSPQPDVWLTLIKNGTLGLLIGGFFWFLTEPPSEKMSKPPVMPFVGESPSPLPVTFTFSPLFMNTQNLDQPTIIVLLVFLLVQFALYLMCRVKLGEIRRSEADASLKLELLANEENLFDSGLYVGLAGTVLALSMVTLGMVQASLMAAYASTLFGILFVAILKIFHVRPLRRKLIIESRPNQVAS